MRRSGARVGAREETGLDEGVSFSRAPEAEPVAEQPPTTTSRKLSRLPKQSRATRRADRHLESRASPPIPPPNLGPRRRSCRPLLSPSLVLSQNLARKWSRACARRGLAAAVAAADRRRWSTSRGGRREGPVLEESLTLGGKKGDKPAKQRKEHKPKALRSRRTTLRRSRSGRRSSHSAARADDACRPSASSTVPVPAPEPGIRRRP